jgi:hypothetical protein
MFQSHSMRNYAVDVHGIENGGKDASGNKHQGDVGPVFLGEIICLY